MRKGQVLYETSVYESYTVVNCMVLSYSWTVNNYLAGHRISKISWFLFDVLTTAWFTSVGD